MHFHRKTSGPEECLSEEKQKKNLKFLVILKFHKNTSLKVSYFEQCKIQVPVSILKVS